MSKNVEVKNEITYCIKVGECYVSECGNKNVGLTTSKNKRKMFHCLEDVNMASELLSRNKLSHTVVTVETKTTIEENEVEAVRTFGDMIIGVDFAYGSDSSNHIAKSIANDIANRVKEEIGADKPSFLEEDNNGK